MVTLAIFGAGTMGRLHAHNAISLPNVVIKYICTPEPESGFELANQVGARLVHDKGMIFEDHEVDLIVISYPPHIRREIIEPALAAGKYVFCEKPLAHTIAEARTIRQIDRHAKTWVSVGMVVRYFWEYKTAADIVRSGRLGRVGMVRTTRAGSFPRGYKNWFADYEKSGGVLLDMAIHDIDFLCWVFGRPVRVYANGLRYAQKTENDYVLVTIRFEGGEIAHVEGSWLEPPNTFYTTFEIACEQGLLEYDRRNVRPVMFTPLNLRPGEKIPVVVPEMPQYESPFKRELREVIEAIQSGAPPPIPVETAMPALEVADAAIVSMRKGEPVILNSKGGAA